MVKREKKRSKKKAESISPLFFLAWRVKWLVCDAKPRARTVGAVFVALQS